MSMALASSRPQCRSRRRVGVIGASETTVSMIALPEMFKRGYNRKLALGALLAGILIPPSVLMIVYGLVANESIGHLYAGAFMPGLLLSGVGR
jgi:TRAP-type mannitol/chloroaromatic compound transport system permease large subunit